MFKIIRIGTEPKFEQVEPEQVYEILYFGVMPGKNGEDVEVVTKSERKTVTELEALKVSLQAQIKDVDLKLAEIAKL